MPPPWKCRPGRMPPLPPPPAATATLIAGTNRRKAYLLHASFALKELHCQWSSIIDFTEVQQLMSKYLHTYELS